MRCHAGRPDLASLCGKTLCYARRGRYTIEKTRESQLGSVIPHLPQTRPDSFPGQPLTLLSLACTCLASRRGYTESVAACVGETGGVLVGRGQQPEGGPGRPGV